MVLAYLKLNIMLHIFILSAILLLYSQLKIILKINSDSEAKTYVNVSTPQASVLILSSTQDVALLSTQFLHHTIAF